MHPASSAMASTIAAGCVLLAPSLASAQGVSARHVYEAAFDNVDGGDWYRLSDDEGTVLNNNQSQVMESLVVMFLTTHDPTYLDRLIWHVDGALSTRDDVRHVIDYRGIEGPCWQDLHYSEGYPTCWVLHSGTIITPMVRGAWLIREHGLEAELAYDGSTFGDKAEAFITAAQETVAHHDDQWKDQGHYIFRPDQRGVGDLAGTTLPINMSNAMGRAMLYLYLLTGETEYLHRVTLLAQRFHDNLVQQQGGFVIWPYYAEDFVYRGEDVGHASTEVDFATELFEQGIVFDATDMERIAATLVDSVVIDDRSFHTNLFGGEVDDALNYRFSSYNWLPTSAWDLSVYTAVRNLYDLEVPAEGIISGGPLRGWATLARYEPVHCIPQADPAHWDDPDSAGDDDWLSATTEEPALLPPQSTMTQGCVTPLEVDAASAVQLRQVLEGRRELVAGWQATDGEFVRWVPWNEGWLQGEDPPMLLAHTPQEQALRIRQQPAAVLPSITEPEPAAAEVGVAWELQLSGSADDPVWWSLASFPTGARIDPFTGAISWSPIEAGRFAFTARLENDHGVADQDFEVCVGEDCGEPRPYFACNTAPAGARTPLLALLGLGLVGLLRRTEPRRRSRASVVLVGLVLLGCDPEPLEPDEPDSEPPEVHESDPPEETESPAETEPPVDTGPVDMDGDGYPAHEDCDDADPTIHPGALDVCELEGSSVDDDCDGVADDDCAVMVDAGLSHSCAVMADGSARCWGSEYFDKASPPAGVFGWISTGTYHSCGITSDGQAQCWGSDPDIAAPLPVGSYTKVDASHYGTLGITSGGSLVWTGANLYVNTPASGWDWVSASCGEGHCCSLRSDGSAECWGRGGNNLDTVDRELVFDRLETGWQHSCGLLAGGVPHCWGEDYYGALEAPEDDSFVELSCGKMHCCALREDGSVGCWGDSGAGQAEPPADLALVSLSAGAYHNCGLTAEGGIVCWGNDAHGQCSAWGG
jgi:hypothetical protein